MKPFTVFNKSKDKKNKKDKKEKKKKEKKSKKSKNSNFKTLKDIGGNEGERMIFENMESLYPSQSPGF